VAAAGLAAAGFGAAGESAAWQAPVNNAAAAVNKIM
jgi:hypothetical protein